MKSLADLARLAGYQVLVEASRSCIEVTGDGRWHVLERETYRFVKHYADRDHATIIVRDHATIIVRDHATIIVRDPLGGRELRDIGERGERRAVLPGNHCKWERTRFLLGVKASGKKWTAQVMCGDNGRRKSVYLGTFDDAVSAAMARDRYVVEHDVDIALNFPNVRELMKKDIAEAVAD